MALGEGQAKMAVKDLNCLVDIHKTEREFYPLSTFISSGLDISSCKVLKRKV